jgi:YD repeat-containing protein
VVTEDASGNAAQTSVNQCVISSDAGSPFCTVSTETPTSRTVTTPESRVTSEVLDAIGRLTSLKAPGAPTVRTEHTGDDVTGIILDADGVAGNADDRRTTLVNGGPSGNDGRLWKITDPLTHQTMFEQYDSADRPKRITLSDNATVSMSYDAMGNVAGVTPPGKAAHAMTCGTHGRIETYAPPVGNQVRFYYDLDRRMDLIGFGLSSSNQAQQVDFV